jgi:hypothetical protein
MLILNRSMRDLVYKRALLWMKKNKKWIVESEHLLSQLPDVLSVASSCYIEIEHHQLFEELKLRQYIEIAPLESEETDEGHSDEIVWHMDHLDLRPRARFNQSNFSCGRLIILIITLGMFTSMILKAFQNFGLLTDPKPAERT